MASHGYKKVAFNQNTQATHLVVAGQSGYRIRVRGGILSAASAVIATFQSGSTVLVPVNLIGGPLVLPPTGGGVGESWFDCAVGEDLNIALSGAVESRGVIFYDMQRVS